MPHCVIEYAAELEGELDLGALIDAVHAGALASGLFPEADIKTRAISYAHHRMGRHLLGQSGNSFVHLSVHLLDGRSDDQKAQLSEGILNRMLPLVSQVASVGVEICDMHRASYRKRVL